MTQAFTETHMQRPTDVLRWPDTRKQIESLFDASYLIQKGQYSQSGKLFQGILKTQSQSKPKKYDPFYLEVKFNMILTDLYGARQYPINADKLIQKSLIAFRQLLRQILTQQNEYIDEEDQQQWAYGDYLKIRIYTTILQISTKSDKTKPDDWLNQIIPLLQTYPHYIPEVFGKLCGCKYLRQFCQNFNSDQIIGNEDIKINEKAKLVDLASTWFILGGKFEKGIELKQKAINLWKDSNSLKQKQKCQIEYMQLKSGSNSEYCERIRKLARITRKLLKGIQQEQKSIKRSDKEISLIIKKGLAKKLKKINEFNQQLDLIQEQTYKANKKKSFWSSSKKSTSLSTKKSLLNESRLLQYYEKSNQFYLQCYSRQKKQQISQLLQNSSKFVLQQRRLMSKVIVPIVQLYTKRRRYGFLIMKNCYIVGCGLLNKNFLKTLPLYNQLNNQPNNKLNNKQDNNQDNTQQRYKNNNNQLNKSQLLLQPKNTFVQSKYKSNYKN